MMTANKKNQKEINREVGDETALYNHFYFNHSNKTEMNFSDAYKVIFLENPQKENLDVSENFWIRKLNSTINVNRTFLPHVI